MNQEIESTNLQQQTGYKLKVEVIEQLTQAMAHLVETQQQQLQQQERRDRYWKDMLKHQREAYWQDQETWGNININQYMEEKNIEDFMLTFERTMIYRRRSDLYNWCQFFLGRQDLPLLRWTLEQDMLQAKWQSCHGLKCPEASRIRLREMKNNVQRDPGDIVL